MYPKLRTKSDDSKPRERSPGFPNESTNRGTALKNNRDLMMMMMMMMVISR